MWASPKLSHERDVDLAEEVNQTSRTQAVHLHIELRQIGQDG